jgi:hypothetical protein
MFERFKNKFTGKFFYATLPYIRHFIFAGCYDNDPWYLETNFAGFYFSLCTGDQHYIP